MAIMRWFLNILGALLGILWHRHKRDMRDTLRNKITAALLALAVLTLTIISCGGDEQETVQTPTTPPSTAASGNRSLPVLPTTTPYPTFVLPTPTVYQEPDAGSTPGATAGATPEATREDPGLESLEPTAAPTPGSISREVEYQYDCINAMTQAFVSWHYNDFEERGFIFSTAQQILDRVLESNQDCQDRGIQAVVATDDEPTCMTKILLNGDALALRKHTADPRSRIFGPTQMIGFRDGNILFQINFEVMPVQHVAGCWLYRFGKLGWVVADGKGTGEQGVYTHFAPECDNALRLWLENRKQFKVDWVATGVDTVECHSKYWTPKPVHAANMGCPVQAETGVTPDGEIVINWSTNKDEAWEWYMPGDGSVCWVGTPTKNPQDPWDWYGYDENGAKISQFELR